MSSEWMEPLLLCGVYFTSISSPQISSHSLEALPRLSTGKEGQGWPFYEGPNDPLSRASLSPQLCRENVHYKAGTKGHACGIVAPKKRKMR